MSELGSRTGAQQKQIKASDETAVIASTTRAGPPASIPAGSADRETAAAPKPTIRVQVVYGDIGDIGRESPARLAGPTPIDAIAVGHYQGDDPVNAERALDEGISGNPAAGSERTLLITSLTERGILISKFSRPFFLPDPRHAERTIVIGCMGIPGQFAVRDLILLVSQMCWSLGLLGKKHLASVLIGSGNGNLAVDRAVEAWMRGLALALGSARTDVQRLQALTFVENAPGKLHEIHDAFASAARSASEFEAVVAPLVQPDVDQAKRNIIEVNPRREPLPVRVIAKLPRRSLSVSVMSDQAVAPDKEIPVDPQWILTDNDRLSFTDNDSEQVRRGVDLFRELIPADFRSRLLTPSPVIVGCDSQAAQIAWEMLAQPDAADQVSPGASPDTLFLGLARGLTRQLLTPATPREYRPTSVPTFRVLIVADPAADRRLVGASDEGDAVRQMFESYKQKVEASGAGRTVEIDALIGPDEASYDCVMERLSGKPYDILHFAGHGEYSSRQPADSGWVFSNGKRFTSADLRQIDAVPRFVFANACVSGNVPASTTLRRLKLAPSLAEAFFVGGVNNFVCTAWQVDDEAARKFALTLYANLLGINDRPRSMHEAMRRARMAARNTAKGIGSWGAYQHYGNPYFRLVQEQ